MSAGQNSVSTTTPLDVVVASIQSQLPATFTDKYVFFMPNTTVLVFFAPGEQPPDMQLPLPGTAPTTSADPTGTLDLEFSAANSLNASFSNALALVDPRFTVSEVFPMDTHLVAVFSPAGFDNRVLSLHGASSEISGTSFGDPSASLAASCTMLPVVPTSEVSVTVTATVTSAAKSTTTMTVAAQHGHGGEVGPENPAPAPAPSTTRTSSKPQIKTATNSASSVFKTAVSLPLKVRRGPAESLNGFAEGAGLFPSTVGGSNFAGVPTSAPKSASVDVVTRTVTSVVATQTGQTAAIPSTTRSGSLSNSSAIANTTATVYPTHEDAGQLPVIFGGIIGAFFALLFIWLGVQIWVRKRTFGQVVRRIDIKTVFADPRAASSKAADVEMAAKPRAASRVSGDGLVSKLRGALRQSNTSWPGKPRISRPTLILPPMHDAAVPDTPPRTYRVGNPYASGDLSSLYSESSKF